MLGMHGTAYANFAVTECDLLIAIGARFDDRVTGKLDTFAPNAKVIHFEIDPAEINKNRIVEVSVLGDVGISLVIFYYLAIILKIDDIDSLNKFLKEKFIRL